MAPDPRRLAEHVKRDRTRRWRSRQAFARAAGISRRTIDRIELAERADYDLATKQAVEVTLGWAEGSFDRTLAGGRPTHVRDPLLSELLALWPRLAPGARRALVDRARDAIQK